uniref:Peroxiredoxin n=1 Tax=Candidatus Kentrum sp. FM TaxID=2126340 RepID=A0A450RYV4_9GAMM|nr:MAG: Peroxiredoxin [Candidatus Kentron sp. FM]VFJ61337.1 MAG: Peroxiredoxin [Candidatus Kentron sp. FM]VFK08953.1 MAG: Peroxiredoxin [Candidatus Kentron sp. FM]
MAQTPSIMLKLGTAAPDFSLPDTNGNSVSRKDFQGAPGLLVVFMCNHCPDVGHIREALAAFAEEYMPKGLAMVGINANDVDDYPDDSPKKMAEEVAKFGYTFPYLFDETQKIAKAYRAACTPDFFLFDKKRKLVYRGQFDDSRPKNNLPVTGRDLRQAVDALLSGRAIDPDQKASVGCNIKWKLGNEPDYFRSIRLKAMDDPLDPEGGAKIDVKIPRGSFLPPREESAPVSLEDRQLEQIGEYVGAHVDARFGARITDLLSEQNADEPPALSQAEFRERMGKVDRELRQQREMIKIALNSLQKRVETAEANMREGFDALSGRNQRFLVRSLIGAMFIASSIVAAVLSLWKG